MCAASTDKAYRKYEGYPVIRVVDNYNDVSYLTSLGWVVLEILEDGALHSFMTTLPLKVVGVYHDPNNYNAVQPTEYVERVNVEMPYALAHHIFVLGLDPNAAHAYLEKERLAAVEAQQKTETAHKVLSEEHAKLQSALADVESRLRQLTGTHESLRQEREQERTLRHRLEDDIGKLRKAVGEMQFRDITWRCDCTHHRTQHNADGCMINECRCRKPPE